jgi:hypothetical protein
MSALTDAGVDCVLLRGLALARTVYLRPGHRTSVDIDVLVSRAEMDRAREVAAALGYEPSPTLRHGKIDDASLARKAHDQGLATALWGLLEVQSDALGDDVPAGSGGL